MSLQIPLVQNLQKQHLCTATLCILTCTVNGFIKNVLVYKLLNQIARSPFVADHIDLSAMPRASIPNHVFVATVSAETVLLALSFRWTRSGEHAWPCHQEDWSLRCYCGAKGQGSLPQEASLHQCCSADQKSLVHAFTLFGFCISYTSELWAAYLLSSSSQHHHDQCQTFKLEKPSCLLLETASLMPLSKLVLHIQNMV